MMLIGSLELLSIESLQPLSPRDFYNSDLSPLKFRGTCNNNNNITLHKGRMPITNIQHVKLFFSEPKCQFIEVLSISGIFIFVKYNKIDNVKNVEVEMIYDNENSDFSFLSVCFPCTNMDSNLHIVQSTSVKDVFGIMSYIFKNSVACIREFRLAIGTRGY